MNNSSHLLPSDARWPADNELLVDVSRLNTDLARYVLRQLDIDAGRAKPMSVDDEHALGHQLIELGQRVQRRIDGSQVAQRSGRQTGQPQRETCPPLIV